VRRIGVLMPGDQTILCGSLASLPSRKRLRTWVGPMAATCGWPSLAGDDINRMRALAQELVGLQPDIILTNGTLPTAALQRETRTIPIVFANAVDPVASGIVARLDRRVGSHRFANLEATLGGKWLELLSEIAPGLKRVTIMFDPDTSVSTFMPSFETAARSLKIVPVIAPVRSDVEIETAIIALGREPGAALSSSVGRARHASHAAHIGGGPKPRTAVYGSLLCQRRRFALLRSRLVDNFRRAATYVDRILRGEKPGDLRAVSDKI